MPLVNRSYRTPPEIDRFDLEVLEKRILLSAEGLVVTLDSDPWTKDLMTTSIVETAVSASESTETDSEWLPVVAVETQATSQENEAASSDGETAATVVNTVDAARDPIDATAAVVFVKKIFPVNTLPNGPPEETVKQTETVAEDTPVPAAAAATLGLANTFTTELGMLDGALSTWGGFFDLGNIDWASQGLTELSLPVVPDSLSSLFGLGALTDGAALPDFSADETIDSFVSSLDTAGFSISAIDGGYNSGGTTIAASTGTSLLEGTYSLTIGTGFGIDGGYAGDSFNDSTSGVLNGLASGVSMDGSITWSGDLVLTLNFVLDSASGLLLAGDSALALSVSGSGTLSGSGTAGGSATSFSGTGTATIAITLGFADTTASYGVADFTAANFAAVASGTAGLSLSFSAGPVDLTFGGTYTLTADLVARTVAQSFTLSLSGTATLPGVTQSDGSTQGVVALSGTYDSGTDVWTINGSASNLKIFGLELTSLNVATTITDGTFAGSFDTTIQTDFLKSGGSPVVISLSATYDRTTVSVTGTLDIASLRFSGTGGSTLLTATDFTATATLTGDIAAGTLTGSLALSVGSATLLPDSTSFTASVTDGDDADTLAFSGSYDFSTQALSITLDQLSVVMPDVLSVAIAGLAISYDRKNTDASQTIATAASVSISLIALKESGSDPPTATVDNLTIRHNGFSFDSASVTLGDHDIDGIITVGSLDVTLTDVDYTIGETPTGTLTLSAATATLFPGSTETATLTGISGSYDVATKAFALSITSLDAEIGSLLTFTATGIAFGYDPTGPPDQIILSVDTLTVAVPSTSVSGTLKGLEVTAAGGFSAVSLSLDTSGLTDALGIGEFLPFNITSMEAVFAGDTNGNGVRDPGEIFSLTAFDLTVTGAFDFDKLGSLPFTPILQIGDTSVSEGDSNSFTFTVSIDSSGIKPKDIGPITIGFTDLTIGDTVVFGGSITLGGYVDGVFSSDFGGHLELKPSANLKNPTGSFSITIAGSFAGGVLNVTGDLLVSFTYGDNISVTNANLGFALQVTAGGDFGLTLNSLALTSGSVESLSMSFGSLMTMSATAVTFNFDATGSESVASFGSMTVAFPGLGGLTGTATNFGFAADGSFITSTGFGVTVSASAAAVKWPSWLPITISALDLSWTDFAADPLDFTIVMSASINSINGLDGLTVSGSVEGVVIDIGDLKEGKFPITDFDTVTVSVSGDAFGGSVSGTLIIGILKLDADGNVVTSFDSTPVAERILYGGIEASFVFGGMSGFGIRVGLSELGPLQVYMDATVPVLLDPVSGLTITNFRAGVTFNSSLPDITDPMDLKNSVFSPADELTAEQWRDQLKTAVKNQAADPPSGDFWAVFGETMIIQGGATLFSAYASTNTFTADIDVLFDTEGRIVVDADATFSDTFSMNFRLYANLTEIQISGTFLFLAEVPEDPTLITYFGALQFKFLAADGSAATSATQASSFFLSLSGGMIAELESVGNITVTATITLTITSTKTTIDFNGTLSMSGLGNALTTAGTFVIEKTGGSTKLYGVAQVDVSFDQLEDKGITASGTAVLEINTSDADVTTSITLPGGTPTSYTLSAQSFAVVVTGTALIKEAGQDLFNMEGLLVFSLNAEGLDLLLDGKVIIGSTSNPVATLDTTGYFAIRSTGVAGRIDLTLVGGFGAGAVDLTVDATFHLEFNSTSEDVTYTLPPGVTLLDGSSTITVSGTSPGGVVEPYLYLHITGTLTVASLFEMQGTFTLSVTPSLLTLNVVASYELKVGSVSLLTYNVAGGFEISEDGVAAALTLTRTVDIPAGQGWSISGTASMQFNTRSSAVTLGGITVEAGVLKVHIAGTLSVEGFDLDGTFDFTIEAESVTITANASINLEVEGLTILNFTLAGELRVDGAGLAAALDLTLGSGVPSGLGWSLDVTSSLHINTTSSEVSVGDVTIAAQSAFIGLTGDLSVAGFTVTGEMSITVGPNFFYLQVTGTIDLKVEGVTILSFTMNTEMLFGSSGLVALAELSLASGVPSGFGWSLSVTSKFKINTTGFSQTISGETIAANSVFVGLTGDLEVSGFTVTGEMFITVGPNFFYLRVDGTLDLKVNSVTLLSFTMNTEMLFGSGGLVALADLTLASGVPSGHGWSLSVTSKFKINTTSSSQTIGGESIAAQSVFVGLTGDLEVSGFTVTGEMSITVGAGFFYLTVNGTLDLKVADVTILSFTLNSEMLFGSGGLVALAELTLASGVPSGLGWSLSVTSRFKINTTSGIQTISGESIAAQSVFVGMIGDLHVSGFKVTAEMSITVGSDFFYLTVNGTLDLRVADVTILRFTMNAEMLFGSSGLVALADLTLASGVPSGLGWSLSVTSKFKINTTGFTQTINGESIAARSAFVGLTGDLHVSGFTVTGEMSITVGEDFFYLTVNGTLDLKVAGVTLLSFTMSSEMLFGSSGLVALADLTLASGVPSGHGWSLSVTSKFKINTTGFTQTINGESIAARSAFVGLTGDLHVSGFTVTGEMSITVGEDFFYMTVNGTLDLKVDNVTILSFTMNADMTFGTSGLAALADLTLASGVPSGHGWSVSVTSKFKINTTVFSQTINGETIAANSVFVGMTGEVTASGFSITGTMGLTVTEDSLTLNVSGTVDVLGVLNLSVSGNFGIFSDGIAFSVALGTHTVNSVVNISGSIVLAVNTTGSVRFGITANSGFFEIDNASVTLAGYGISGSLFVSSSGVITVPASNPLTLSVLGQTVSFSGTINLTTGLFNLTGAYTVTLGDTSVAAITGSMSLTLYHQDVNGVTSSGLSGTIIGHLHAFGIQVTSLNAAVSLSSDGSFSLSVTESFTLASFVDISASFSVSVNSSHQVSLTLSGSMSIFGLLNSSISGSASSATGKWSLIGQASVSFGGSSIGASMTVAIVLGNSPYTANLGFFSITVNPPVLGVNGNAHAGISYRGHGVGLSGTFNGSLTGSVLSADVHGSVDILVHTFHFSKTVHFDLSNGHVWLSDVADSLVYFDANLNGVLDDGEPFTRADTDGAFQFHNPEQSVSNGGINHLGALQDHDANDNGMIDVDEGSLLLTGGTTRDGLVNTETRQLGVSKGHTLYNGATIFLDLNGNGVLDANETSTTSTTEGYYDFDDHQDAVEVAALGDLAPFDLNLNGVIEADEGVLTVTGGRLAVEAPGSGLSVGDALPGNATLDRVTASGRTYAADATIFLDLNGNGILDSGEVSTTTNDQGDYSFHPESQAAIARQLGALAPFDLNRNGEIESSEGQLVRIGGTRAGSGTITPASAENRPLFDDNQPVGISGWNGATVFLDLNNNGTLDAGEVSTTTDDVGYYSFLAATDFDSQLGVLAAYDLNGNGTLDPDEGVFVVEGGTDQHSGLPNERTLTVLATHYGTPFGTQISPLSEMLTYLVLDGMSQQDANTALVAALGLPVTTDLLTFNPDLDANAAIDGEAMAKLISILAESGAEFILGLAAQNTANTNGAQSAEGLAHGGAENFVIRALADLVRDLEISTAITAPDADGNPVADEPAIDFGDEALIRGVLATAASMAGVVTPSDAQLDVVAEGLHNIADRLVAVQESGVVDLTAALARVNTFVKTVFEPAVGNLVTGTTSTTEFAEDFSAEGIRETIRTIGTTTPNIAPVVTGLDDVSLSDLNSTGSIAFAVADGDGLPDEIEVRVQSDNAFLLPATRVVATGADAARALEFSPVAGRWGTATLTVIADDGQGGANSTTTSTITITVRYTYAEFVQSESTKAEAAAADLAAEEREAQIEAKAVALAQDLSQLSVQAALGPSADLILPDASTGSLLAEVSLAALGHPRVISGL